MVVNTNAKFKRILLPFLLIFDLFSTETWSASMFTDSIFSNVGCAGEQYFACLHRNGSIYGCSADC